MEVERKRARPGEEAAGGSDGTPSLASLAAALATERARGDGLAAECAALRAEASRLRGGEQQSRRGRRAQRRPDGVSRFRSGSRRTPRPPGGLPGGSAAPGPGGLAEGAGGAPGGGGDAAAPSTSLESLHQAMDALAEGLSIADLSRPDAPLTCAPPPPPPRPRHPGSPSLRSRPRALPPPSQT